jgi:hypothetical protein
MSLGIAIFLSVLVICLTFGGIYGVIVYKMSQALNKFKKNINKL